MAYSISRHFDWWKQYYAQSDWLRAPSEPHQYETLHQTWKIWDSGYEDEKVGTCDENSNPVGFKIKKSPNVPDPKSNAFFGMTYQG